MKSGHPFLDPKILGFWVRCLREAQHMSQDALAALSRVDIRTVQRMEAGNAVAVTSRRSIAKALGFDKPDIFDDPEFVADVHRLLEGVRKINEEALDKQHPEHVRVKAERVANGAALLRLADQANALMLTADDEVSQDAQKAAATLFDYMRDLLDLDEASYAENLDYSQELETMLRELEGMGTAAYSAMRNVKMVGETWVDKTPLSMAIGYLVVVPAQRNLDFMFVARRVQFN